MPTPILARSAALLALSALTLACSQAGEGTGASTSATTSGPGGEGESEGSTATTGASASASASASVTLTATITATASGSDSDTSESGETCGNGAIDPGEVCDGVELGGQTCVGLGAPYIGGDLGCSPLCTSYDASACEVDSNAPALKINELLGKGAAEGPYAGLGDLIEIYNAGGDVADLGGFKLSDEPDLPDDKTFVFPAGVTLAPGAFLVVAEYDEVTMTGEFPFGISTSNEETISLADPRGVVVDTVTVDGPLTEVSYCRLPDGEDAWSTCAQTPGAANLAGEGMPGVCGDGVVDRGEACDGDDLGGMTCVLLSDTFSGGELACTAGCAYDTAGCTSTLDLVLNEVSSSDVDPIELYNAGAAPIDVSGWILTDDTAEPYDPGADAEELTFPPGTVIPAKGYLVVSKGMGALDHPFGLGAGGDSVRLFDADLSMVDAVTYGDGEAAVSYCRAPDGPDGVWMAGCSATFGSANDGP